MRRQGKRASLAKRSRSARDWMYVLRGIGRPYCAARAYCCSFVASAAWSLWHGEGEEFSTVGLIVTIIAIPVMWWLSRSKLAIAEKIGSGALRADAIESVTCGYLAFVVLVGLVAQLVFNAWWVDGITSLAIVYFLVKEGREAWEGEECSDDE